MLCHPFFWTVLPLAFFHRAASKIASKSATAGRVPSARPASPPRRGAQNASLRVCRSPSSMVGSVENNHIAGAFLNGIHRRLAI